MHTMLRRTRASMEANPPGEGAETFFFDEDGNPCVIGHTGGVRDAVDADGTPLMLAQQGSGPSTAASQLKVYAKLVDDVLELFVRKPEDGAEVQLTAGDEAAGGGGGPIAASDITDDSEYDAGTVDLALNQARSDIDAIFSEFEDVVGAVEELTSGFEEVTEDITDLETFTGSAQRILHRTDDYAGSGVAYSTGGSGINNDFDGGSASDWARARFVDFAAGSTVVHVTGFAADPGNPEFVPLKRITNSAYGTAFRLHLTHAGGSTYPNTCPHGRALALRPGESAWILFNGVTWQVIGDDAAPLTTKILGLDVDATYTGHVGERVSYANPGGAFTITFPPASGLVDGDRFAVHGTNENVTTLSATLSGQIQNPLTGAFVSSFAIPIRPAYFACEWVYINSAWWLTHKVVGYREPVTISAVPNPVVYDAGERLNGTITLTADRVFRFDNPMPGTGGIVRIVQDGTGGHSITAWQLNGGSGVLFPGGTPPTQSAAAGAIDTIEWYYDGTNVFVKEHGLAWA